MKNIYSQLKVSNPTPFSRTGRYLHRLAQLGKGEHPTTEVVGGHCDSNGNDHNALISLKNGGLIKGKKKKGHWFWRVTAKGKKWDEQYIVKVVVEKL